MNKLDDFVKYCKRNNIEFLPQDIKFLKKSIESYFKNEQTELFEDYVVEWYRGMSNATKSQYRQKFGRKRANLWLIGKIVRHVVSNK